MAKETRSTRAELRAHAVPPRGVYGMDVEDAGADSWTGRYLCRADTPQQARARIRAAAFHNGGSHRRGIQSRWTPKSRPQHGPWLEVEDDGWYRSRHDDGGWTPWESLGAGYRHPPQGLAAIDPSVR